MLRISSASRERRRLQHVKRSGARANRGTLRACTALAGTPTETQSAPSIIVRRTPVHSDAPTTPAHQALHSAGGGEGGGAAGGGEGEVGGGDAIAWPLIVSPTTFLQPP
eukprot:5441141-Prymnesium_polylepis.2